MELTSEAPQLINPAIPQSRERWHPIGPPTVDHVLAADMAAHQESVTAPWLALLQASQGCNTVRISYAYVWKRGLDVLIALLALVALSPLLLVTALAIRLDSRGPAVFRQERIGRGGKLFTVYKFRTMAHNPDEALHLFRDVDGEWRHKVKNDPRITRVGRVIRRSSIDELPQLVNMLRGEMSLVGPRPELPQIVQQYADWQHQRHLVRPGLTGWWQIQGRSDKPMHEHTELDLHYVEHLSFRLDALIVWRTFTIVFKGFGAF